MVGRIRPAVAKPATRILSPTEPFWISPGHEWPRRFRLARTNDVGNEAAPALAELCRFDP